jgi:hypothetical protein
MFLTDLTHHFLIVIIIILTLVQPSLTPVDTVRKTPPAKAAAPNAILPVAFQNVELASS